MKKLFSVLILVLLVTTGCGGGKKLECAYDYGDGEKETFSLKYTKDGF